ncbi:tetratricopeptide repeat protein [bacterium]|nr:tetratricopeptide repeat protein [bacterium]
MEKKVSQVTLARLITIFVLGISILLNPGALLADDEAEWEQLINQANSYFEQENYEQAVATASEAMEFAENRFGTDHPATITSYYTLGYFYGSLGYPDEAINLQMQALELSKALFGEDQPDTMEIKSSLAQLLAEQGRFDEALPLLESVLAFRQTNSGETDPETLSTLITLAQVNEALGQYKKAEELLKSAIILYEQSAGADDPDALFAKESLASVYKTQGQFQQAREILNQVYQIKSSTLGDKHPETIITMGGLAEVIHKMGEYDEAEPLYQNAILLFKEEIGEEDPELYTIIANMAQLHQDQGRYGEAEALFLKVYDFEKSALGEDHPNTIIDLNNLAGIYRLQGKYGQSETAYIEALNLIKDVLGETHPETISIMNNLALLFENLGLYDQAEPLYKTAMKYSEEVLGTTHPTTLALMNNLASLYESQGVFERSEPLYNKTIQLNTQVYGPEHPNTIAGINNLGYLYLMQNEYDKAEPLFTKVYEIWRAQLGERHQKTLKALNNLARVYHWQGETDKAEAMFITALNLRKEVLGAKHPDVVRSMIDFSALMITQKKYRAAEDLLLETITLAEEILGDKHQYTFEAINNLAKLYEIMGETDKALKTMQIGFDRRSEFFDRVLWAAGENTRQSYIELHKPEQDRFLKLLVSKNDIASARLALHSSLQRKGLLLKITSEIHKIVEMMNTPELKNKAEELHEKRKQLASLTLSGPTTETPEEFRKTVVGLENDLEELQAEMGRISMIYHLASQPISVEKVFKNLEVEDVLVDYIAYNDEGTDKMFAVVAQTDPQKCFVWWNCIGNKINIVPLGNLASIKKVVDIFREVIQDEDSEEEDLLETGYDVFNKVWKPLLPYLKSKKSIYIVPDSVLHLLPFDAIVNENDNFLIESTDLKVLSSSRDLVVSTLPDAEGEFIILAGPDYDLEKASVLETKKAIASKRSGVDRGLRISHGLRSLSFEPLLGAEIEGKTIKQVSDSFEALPGAEDEGKAIDEVARKQAGTSIIYLNQDAEENQLRSIGKSPKMIHIATHGFFLQAEERLKKRLLSLQRGGVQTAPPPGDNPLLRAGLAFAGINSNAPFLGEIDTDNDGVLTALEVLSLNLSGTRLVVLSACETGVGEIYAGEGVYGLRRAFQEAGVKSVVNSLWPVSDEGTRRLMTAFYQNLFDGVPPRKALKAAQLELLNSEWSAPYYWAAFVLVERRFSANM